MFAGIGSRDQCTLQRIVEVNKHLDDRVELRPARAMRMMESRASDELHREPAPPNTDADGDVNINGVEDITPPGDAVLRSRKDDIGDYSSYYSTDEASGVGPKPTGYVPSVNSNE